MDIVLGLGFGDEGKGLTTSYLCSLRKRPIVVRFNGGHQAGHTVVHRSTRHVFSSFGSGTMQGVPTYWSKYCTFYPTAVVNEYKSLFSKGFQPKLYVHPLCPVTTPYDVEANRRKEKEQKHGSVGVGFGTTLKRQEAFYKLHVQDLFFPVVLRAKLDNIAKYYGFDVDLTNFLEDVQDAKQFFDLKEEDFLTGYNCVFEGAQGILLDQDFGFFPNVTPSNTTSKNALEIISRIVGNHAIIDLNIYYVTRTYQTRHGNGFMSNEKTLDIKNNENETNRPHEFQGNFRMGDLDPSLINYAITCDMSYHDQLLNLIRTGKVAEIKRNLVVTCADQYSIDVLELLTKIDFEFSGVLMSTDDNHDDFSNFVGINKLRVQKL